MPLIERLDDLWSAEFEENDGTLFRRLFQPGRREKMQEIAAIRNSGLVRDREVFGRWCLDVPYEDLELLKRSTRWRDLGSVDYEIRSRTWRRFMQHPDSAPYRVRERAS